MGLNKITFESHSTCLFSLISSACDQLGGKEPRVRPHFKPHLPDLPAGSS